MGFTLHYIKKTKGRNVTLGTNPRKLTKITLMEQDEANTFADMSKFPAAGSYRYSKLKRPELEKIIVMKQSQLDGLIKESILHGDHLSGQPFIPEYIGFEDDYAELADGSRQRIYWREGRTLFRYPSLREDKENVWMVDYKTEIKIPNMLIGIIVLESLGFGVNVQRYVRDGKC